MKSEDYVCPCGERLRSLMFAWVHSVTRHGKG